MSEPRVLARHQFRQRLYSDACASCGGLLAAEAHWMTAEARDNVGLKDYTPPGAIPPEPTIPVDMVPLEGAGARYYQIVILRADQVDLIARRVIEFLHKDFEEDTSADVGSRDTAQEKDFTEAGDTWPGPSFPVHQRCLRTWRSAATVRCQLELGHSGPHIQNGDFVETTTFAEDIKDD